MVAYQNLQKTTENNSFTKIKCIPLQTKSNGFCDGRTRAVEHFSRTQRNSGTESNQSKVSHIQTSPTGCVWACIGNIVRWNSLLHSYAGLGGSPWLSLPNSSLTDLEKVIHLQLCFLSLSGYCNNNNALILYQTHVDHFLKVKFSKSLKNTARF